MAEIWYDVDIALAEVPINLMPIVVAAGTTIDDGVVYNEAGLDLNWNFITTLGAFTQTNLTPTDTGGAHDFVNQGNGMYTVEIPASAGTINNDTEGFGWFSGFATADLPWRGPVIGFRAAAINNSLIDGPTVDVNVTAMAAGVVTEAAIANAAIDNATFAADVGSTAYATNIIALAVRKALDEIKLDHLVAIADADDPVNNSIIAKMVSKAATADWSAFTNTTDSLEAIRDDRTLPAADYVVVGDTLARVTLVDTTTTNTDMKGTDSAATEAKQDTMDTNVDSILALLDDARGEPGQGALPVNPDMATKIDYIYKFLRNKKLQTATLTSIMDDAGTTTDHKSTVSDDGTTATIGEMISGA